MLITFVITIVLAIFSTSVMSYVAMATPIGPWIAPTLVLIAMLLFRVFGSKQQNYSTELGVAVFGGSIGGIMAVACGFSLPTLYFLDPGLFDQWMACPSYFVMIVSGLALSAGWLGMWLANMLEHELVIRQELAFPVGKMVSKMIAAQHQVKRAYELIVGFIATVVFCVLKDGMGSFGGVIARSLTLVPRMTFGIFVFPVIRFDLWPMLWAIGFVTGHVIAIPLAVGGLSKVIVAEPLRVLWFSNLSSMEFLLAFCSGMVLSGVLVGLVKTPKTLFVTLKKKLTHQNSGLYSRKAMPKSNWIELGLLLVCIMIFLSAFSFSFSAQIYLVLFSVICAYQIAIIAGKIGLAQLGRFATFVMVPGMLIFKFDVIQIALVATFVEICCGVCTDVLFGRKLALLDKIDAQKMRRYQYGGLVLSALVVGIVFWFLINHFGLGSDELFAQRAQARALLVNAREFNYWVLLLGGIFGFALKQLKMSPMLVLGGLLMPLNISLGLITGGLLTFFTKDAERWYPFWSGVFASNSIWMLLKAIF